MLAANMDMRSPDRPLEDRPEGFEAVHMNVAPRVFFGPVVDRVMPVAETGEDTIWGPIRRS